MRLVVMTANPVSGRSRLRPAGVAAARTAGRGQSERVGQPAGRGLSGFACGRAGEPPRRQGADRWSDVAHPDPVDKTLTPWRFAAGTHLNRRITPEKQPLPSGL